VFGAADRTNGAVGLDDVDPGFRGADEATRNAGHDRTDQLGHFARLPLPRLGIAGDDRRGEDVDPVEASRIRVPERTLAEEVVSGDDAPDAALRRICGPWHGVNRHRNLAYVARDPARGFHDFASECVQLFPGEPEGRADDPDGTQGKRPVIENRCRNGADPFVLLLDGDGIASRLDDVQLLVEVTAGRDRPVGEGDELGGVRQLPAVGRTEVSGDRLPER
jgi:hypothetical protein